MPFCTKCGFQVSEQMQFCPRCGALLASLTTQRSGRGRRVTLGLIPQSLFFVLFASLAMLSMNASTHVSLLWQIPWIASGIAAGMVVGVAVTQRQLKSIGKNETGKTIPAIPTLLFILGSFFVLQALFLVILPIPVLLTVMYGVFNFIFCAGIVIISARAFLLVEWERIHKMRLYQRGSRFYAVPTLDSSNH
jgi:hypothetical protein